jgi:hypothetical protein
MIFRTPNPKLPTPNAEGLPFGADFSKGLADLLAQEISATYDPG